MTTIFNIDNHIEDFSENINIDDLYERKKTADLQKLETFNKILNRIHVRIKLTSKRTHEKHCWFVIPEVILGVTYFDHAGCISYVLDKLKTNGFNVFYYHPNTLHISWDHWIPKYVRDEIKKKTGVVVDECGNQMEPEKEPERETFQVIPKERPKKLFTPIDSYKPKGNLF
jgi:hypothetical protein